MRSYLLKTIAVVSYVEWRLLLRRDFQNRRDICRVGVVRTSEGDVGDNDDSSSIKLSEVR